MGSSTPRSFSRRWRWPRRSGSWGKPTRLLVPLGISLGGNTVVLGRAAADSVPSRPGSAFEAARRLAAWLRGSPAPPRFAVVHAFSTHNLLLRYWLATAGIHPDRDLEIVSVPPEQVVSALAEGRIAGFCAGAPWGGVAEREGAGRVLVGTSTIWPNHPEKCLTVAASWAEAEPDAVQGLLRALLQAGRLCDAPEHSADLAGLLARDPALLLPEGASLESLPGGAGPERIGFHAHAAWLPRRQHARWFLEEMRRWGWLDARAELTRVAQEVYRPDLLAAAAKTEGLLWSSREEDVSFPTPAPIAPV
jgi:two-component system, oxyanion-binding sensor